MHIPHRLAPFAVLLVGSLAACGGSVTVGGSTIAKADVQSGASAALTKQVGQTPKSIDCPNDLDAKVGASERCTLTDNQGNTLGMTVTVDSVDNGTANYSVAVDAASPAPTP